MYGWSREVRKRADKAHAAKKVMRKQKRHLRAIKSETQLRQMVLASRRKERRGKDTR